jgi:hypothetical protein
MKTRGIVILAFGRIGYAYAAFNLFRSIRFHNTNVPITVIHDGMVQYNLAEFSDFENTILLPNDLIMHNGRIDPAKVKFEVYDYLPYYENLILDADNICLKDLEPLLLKLSERKEDYLVQYVHCGGKNDSIDYTWADNETVWNFFNLKDDAKICSLQSSVQFVRKSTASKKLFKEFKKYFYKGFPQDKIKQWGGTMADELFISGVLAKTGGNYNIGFKIDFLGHKFWDMTLEEIEQKHYLLALYGNGIGKKLTKDVYIEWADRIMHSIQRSFNAEHRYKMFSIMRDKHVNFTPNKH